MLSPRHVAPRITRRAVLRDTALTSIFMLGGLAPVSVSAQDTAETFESRAAFEAASLADDVTSWVVMDGGQSLSYQRDPSGTAIRSANGVTGAPSGVARPEHYGAAGSQALNACFAAHAGETVELSPQRTYPITTQIVIGDGTTVFTNGAIFEIVENFSDQAAAINISEAKIAGDLIAHVAAGLRVNRVVNCSGTDVEGDIRITSADHQANNNRKNNPKGDNLHGALRTRSNISGKPISLRDIYISGFDFAHTSSDFGAMTVGNHQISNALRGWKIDGGDTLVHGDVYARGRSPNGTEGHIPGQNAYLFSNIREVRGGYLDVADTFEHGVRQGGKEGDTTLEFASFNGIKTQRTGQSGIKLSSSAGDTKRISLGDVEVSTAGYREADASAAPKLNEAGILAEMIEELRVNSYILRAEDGRKYSCHNGLDLRAVQNFSCEHWEGSNCASHFLYATDVSHADRGQISLAMNGLSIKTMDAQNVRGKLIFLDFKKEAFQNVDMPDVTCENCNGAVLVHIKARGSKKSRRNADSAIIKVSYKNVTGKLSQIDSASPNLNVEFVAL